MLEISVEDKVCDYAEARGWLVRKVVYRGRRNAPDRWLMKNGRTVTIETKKFGKRPNIGQRREHDRLRAAGIPVFVVDTVEDGYKLIDDLDRGIR